MEDPLQVYRSRIQHEDTLRSQRLGWMLTASGFLFAALAFAWDRAGSLPLVYVIAAVGLMVSVSTLVGSHANDLAIDDLRKAAQRSRDAAVSAPLEQAPREDPPVVGMDDEGLRAHGLLRLGPAYWLFRLLYPWRFIPAVLALAWVAVMTLAPIAEVGAGR